MAAGTFPAGPWWPVKSVVGDRWDVRTYRTGDAEAIPLSLMCRETGASIAFMVGDTTDQRTRDSESIAYLIAAAPALFVAAEAALSVLASDGRDVQAARDLLANALTSAVPPEVTT